MTQTAAIPACLFLLKTASMQFSATATQMAFPGDQNPGSGKNWLDFPGCQGSIFKHLFELAALPLSNQTIIALLDAAEWLFAEHGIEAVSLRRITREAKTNVAAVHYHFGGKEELLEQTLLRRMQGIARRRAELLAQTVDDDPVGAWVTALVRPLAELIDKEGDRGRAYVRLMWHCQSERSAWVARIAQEHFADVTTQVARALEGALPGLARTTVRLRAELAVRLVFDYLAADLPRRPAAALDELQRFIRAGLAAH